MLFPGAYALAAEAPQAVQEARDAQEARNAQEALAQVAGQHLLGASHQTVLEICFAVVMSRVKLLPGLRIVVPAFRSARVPRQF